MAVDHALWQVAGLLEHEQIIWTQTVQCGPELWAVLEQASLTRGLFKILVQMGSSALC
jgi:hypothetical protein